MSTRGGHLRRRLLARMCLVREEVQNTAEELAISRGVPHRGFEEAAAQSRGAVSRRSVAFLQVGPRLPL